MKRIARPTALVLTVSVLCFLLPQPLLAQPYLAKVIYRLYKLLPF